VIFSAVSPFWIIPGTPVTIAQVRCISSAWKNPSFEQFNGTDIPFPLCTIFQCNFGIAPLQTEWVIRPLSFIVASDLRGGQSRGEAPLTVAAAALPASSGSLTGGRVSLSFVSFYH